jgi:hypothetical protein
MPNEPKDHAIWKSAKTGLIVTAAYAEANPNECYRDRINPNPSLHKAEPAPKQQTGKEPTKQKSLAELYPPPAAMQPKTPKGKRR